MTNVPGNIREMWTDLYKLFDKHYLLQNTAEEWQAFWDDAEILYEKYGRNERYSEGIALVSGLIGDRFKED